MKNIIKELIRTSKTALLNYKYRDEIDTKKGISMAEAKRIAENFPYSEGVANFFGNSFYFSSGVSFLHSVDEIFRDQIYLFKTTNNQPYIIDCGSNIGLSLYYFKQIYPNSEVVCFEPDREIFKILKKNAALLPNQESIHLHNKAVWTEDTTLEFFVEGGLAGSCSVDFSGRNNIEKIPATDLKKFMNKKVDFLKIDIEGAENKVIFDIRNKLHLVERMFLEYHGIPGDPQNLGDILTLLSENGFTYYIQTADHIIKLPFCEKEKLSFNQQLNIFCFRD